MEVMAAVAAWALQSACQNASSYGWLSGLCAPIIDVAALSASLSEGAHVYLPSSPEFEVATARWSAGYTPDVRVVVVPAVEADVAATVRFANKQNVPFLAVSGGHGAITTVSRMQRGIEIWMNQLNDIEVAPDGKSATVGGGALSKHITDTLWAAGKQTVTGACECTSLLGPGLGGGHGFLQGHYGLASDQFISMNIVLADGTQQTIDQQSDLWWAMQGAGHNFGIVTSVAIKVYDIVHGDWSYASFTYQGDKVESVYEAINNYLLKNGTRPVDMMDYSIFMSIPAIDPANPVAVVFILQEGVTSVDTQYTQPFSELGPIMTGAGSGSYMDLPTWTGMSNDDLPCQEDSYANVRFPIDLQEYDPAAQRRVYERFASALRETPALNTSLFLFEGYALEGVRAVPAASTAFAFRDSNVLVSSALRYPSGDPAFDRQVADLGGEMRQILYEASGRDELRAYVNYAFGDETKENMYGYEQSRQDRLLALKNKYDPERRFSFYAPIA